MKDPKLNAKQSKGQNVGNYLMHLQQSANPGNTKRNMPELTRKNTSPFPDKNMSAGGISAQVAEKFKSQNTQKRPKSGKRVPTIELTKVAIGSNDSMQDSSRMNSARNSNSSSVSISMQSYASARNYMEEAD